MTLLRVACNWTNGDGFIATYPNVTIAVSISLLCNACC